MQEEIFERRDAREKEKIQEERSQRERLKRRSPKGEEKISMRRLSKRGVPRAEFQERGSKRSKRREELQKERFGCDDGPTCSNR